MPPADAPQNDVRSLDIPLHRDSFLRTLLHHLAGTLQDVIGIDEASGFVSVVGQRIGRELDESYRTALKVPHLTREQVAEVLVDLKRRIGGQFYVVEQSDERIVFGNRRCPFEERVHGRPALCMMTSNVFGSIAAENLGYARVVLDRTIANGDGECRVVVSLQPTSESAATPGREYVRG